MVSCREIINLHSLAKLKIVAGKDGLYHQVRWVHFIDLPDVLPWVQGGELLIITGIALNGDMRGLTTLVQGLIHKNIAGIIINVGPYIKKIPDEVIQIADAANFPVFELPWEVKLVEVTQDICSYIVLKQTEKHLIYNFFEQLLLQPVEDIENLVERAGVYGYDLSKPQQVVIFSPANLEKYVQEEEIKDEFAIVALKTQLEQLVRDILVMQGKKLLVTLWMDKVVLLLPTDAKTTKQQSNFVFV
ncbi:MAG: transcriptional regulator, CdaR, partial [Massilibacillus sp.]|nr:transcriptional regulator, CdaR [Massilibacillus sp.]